MDTAVAKQPTPIKQEELKMPRGDGTGPMGMGPKTGRGAGFCAGYNIPGTGNPLSRAGCGMGGGRGHRNRFYATGLTRWQRGNEVSTPVFLSREDELEALKKKAEFFERNLKELHGKIEKLEASKKE